MVSDPRSVSRTAVALEAARRYRLSRHLQIRPDGKGFVAESLITGHREALPNAASVRLLLTLKEGVRPRELLADLNLPQTQAVLLFLNRCLQGGLLTELDDDGVAAEDSIAGLGHWEPHDLAFHLRSRRGRNPHPVGSTWHLAESIPPEPVRRPARDARLGEVCLPGVDVDRLIARDRPLTLALEGRRSRYSIEPVTLEALSTWLFRAARVTGTVGEKKLVRKVYPSGGSLHSLEIYVVAYRCVDLEPGGYRYDPFDHRLEWLRRLDGDIIELLTDAQKATRELPDLPSVLLIFASRFGRVTRKYQSIAYHVILQEVGALYQTLYLVAEALDLAVAAIGSGDSERFARAFGTDFFSESSVGEMIAGARLE